MFAANYSRAIAPIAEDLYNNIVDILDNEQKVQSINANNELSQTTDALFSALAPFTLVDCYEAYQSLIDRWNMIGGDLEILQSEGVVAANVVDKNMVVKKKDGKDVEVQDGWVGRVIPIPLVEKVLLADDLAALQTLRDSARATTARIAEIIENLPEAEGETPWLKEDGATFIPKELKAKVKRIKQEFGKVIPVESVEAQLVEADKLLDIEKKQNSEVKTALAEIEAKAIDTIKELTVPAIQELLEAKWVKPLADDMHQVAQNLIDRFADSLTSLSAKYSETLVDIDRNITTAEKSLASLIDNLTGPDNDIAGLREFQKLLRHE